MFFDACHSGARKDKSGSGEMGSDLANFIDQQAEGRVMLSSCGLDEVAYEDPKSRHGIFTKYLIDGLRGRADDNGGRCSLRIGSVELHLEIGSNLGVSKRQKTESAHESQRLGPDYFALQP